MDAAREGEGKEKGAYKIPGLFKKAGWDLCHGLSWQRFGGWMGLTPLNASVFGQMRLVGFTRVRRLLKFIVSVPIVVFYSRVSFRRLLSCLGFYVLDSSFHCQLVYLWHHLSIVHAHHSILLSSGEKYLRRFSLSLTLFLRINLLKVPLLFSRSCHQDS